MKGRKLKEVRDGSNGSRTLSKRNRMDGWMDGWNSMYDGDMRFPGFLFSFFVVDVLMFLISAECFSPFFGWHPWRSEVHDVCDYM